MAQPPGCASPPDWRALRGARLVLSALWALGRSGIIPEACRAQAVVRGGTRRFGYLAAGQRVGPIAVTESDMRGAHHNILRSARRGSTAPRQTKTVYCKVQTRVPTPPSPIIT